MIYDELRDIFKIPSDKLDDAILSLTHKQMLSINDNVNYKENSTKVNYYSQIGKCVTALILKEYIKKYISEDCNILSRHFLAREKYLDKFFELYKLDRYMIFKEEVCSNKNLQNITSQFIGFLFLNIEFNRVKEILDKVFINYNIDLDIDYLSIVNMYLEGKVLNFKEIKKEGTAHKPIFIYELLIDGIAVQASGQSKKEAKKKCAERFCKENLNKNKIQKYLDSGKEKKEKTNNIKISPKKKMNIQKLARNLRLDESVVRICCTHKSTRETDNTTYRSIGSEIEVILILIYIYEYLKIRDFKKIQEIRSYLNSNIDLYEDICSRLKIENAIFHHNLTEEGIKKAKIDCIKAIIYATFYSAGRDEFIKKLYLNYDSFLKEMDLVGLNPTTNVQEIIQAYGIENIKYLVEGSKTSFECKANLIINNRIFEYSGSGKNKRLAKNEAAKYVLNDLMNVEKFSIENIHEENILDKNLYREFMSFILSDDGRFKTYMVKSDCLNIKTLIDKEINSLVGKLEELILYFINEIKLSEGSIRIFIEKLDKEFFNNCICGLQIIFLVIANDILDECLIKRNLGYKYNLEERKKYVYDKSRERIIENIHRDPNYIKTVPKPDEELQMIAVKKNENIFLEINNPCENVVNYIYNNDMRLLFKNNSQQNLEFLIELKVKEIKKLIEKNNILIIKPHCFDIYIKAIFKLIDIKKAVVAVGFAYKSGIELIEEELNSVILKNGKVEMIIGALQQYKSDKPIVNMDLDTAKKLNTMLKQGVKIRTNENCFYHGKIYCFVGEEHSVVIVGSTNLSRNAFRYNKELDTLFMFNNTSNEYTKWIENLWENSIEIDCLDEEKFKNQCFEDIGMCDNQNSISIEEMKKQVNLVTDKMLKARLLLWLEYKPSNIYENIAISNNEYIAIEYKEKSMVVLESFVPGNAYFVFYDMEIRVLLKQIENKTKSEIFEMSNMEKRGYHVREQLKLEIKIKSYFL